jgi:hypothetical protein
VPRKVSLLDLSVIARATDGHGTEAWVAESRTYFKFMMSKEPGSLSLDGFELRPLDGATIPYNKYNSCGWLIGRMRSCIFDSILLMPFVGASSVQGTISCTKSINQDAPCHLPHVLLIVGIEDHRLQHFFPIIQRLNTEKCFVRPVFGLPLAAMGVPVPMVVRRSTVPGPSPLG